MEKNKPAAKTKPSVAPWTWESAPKVINCNQAAQLLEVSVHTVYRWRVAGKMRSEKRGKEWYLLTKEIYKLSREYTRSVLENSA